MILYNTSNDAQWHKYIFSGIQSTVCRSRYLLLGSYLYDVVAFSFLVVDDVRITGCIRHSNTEQLQFQKICLKIFQSFLLSEINLMLGTKLHGYKIKAGFEEFHKVLFLRTEE